MIETCNHVYVRMDKSYLDHGKCICGKLMIFETWDDVPESIKAELYLKHQNHPAFELGEEFKREFVRCWNAEVLEGMISG